jgi:hypothetical protein
MIISLEARYARGKEFLTNQIRRRVLAGVAQYDLCYGKSNGEETSFVVYQGLQK